MKQQRKRSALLSALMARRRIVPLPITGVAVVIISVGLSSVLMFALLSATRVKRRDRQKFKSLKTYVPTSRAQISAEFNGFTTSEFRLKFVKLLGERGIKPTGWWPEGVMPNQYNDEASTLLAQLEEKWLGLTH